MQPVSVARRVCGTPNEQLGLGITAPDGSHVSAAGFRRLRRDHSTMIVPGDAKPGNRAAVDM